jgi:ubiquitin-associated SH3 domain-containing protein
MGFSKARALKALAATGAAGKSVSAVQIASDWIMAHAHDQNLDDPCPRHFYLHLCPGAGTALAKNLQTFWDASSTQIGWNGAHNSNPHITLVAGLAVPDEKVDEFVNIVKTIYGQFHADLITLSEMTFEKYVSPNFLGFFVGKNEEILLRSFVQALADEVSASLGLSIDAKGQNESKSSFHLTLAYQVLLNYTEF